MAPKLSLVAVSVLSALASLASAETHRLPLTPSNVHWGYFDATLEPVLRIASGDVVRVETMVARGLERFYLAGASSEEFSPEVLAVEREVSERGPGAHPMSGPIYVEGAEPGDVLEVVLRDIEFLLPIGVSGFLPAGGTLPEEFPYAGLRLFRLDTEARTSEFLPGIDVPLAPFFGCIGVAPPELRGRISSGPPGFHGGNLDLKELTEGARLFLPVHVDGALLSIGDGHASQGDGEVSGTAIETFLSGEVEVILHKGRPIRWPRAETPTHYIAIGLHTDLDEAARLATSEAVRFVVERTGMSRGDAYILASVAADLRVTQLVDGTKGVHALLAKELFRGMEEER